MNQKFSFWPLHLQQAIISKRFELESWDYLQIEALFMMITYLKWYFHWLVISLRFSFIQLNNLGKNRFLPTIFVRNSISGKLGNSFFFKDTKYLQNASKWNQSQLYSFILLEMTASLWTITAKNIDWSIGPLARPFARSLAPLTHSLAPKCSLRSHPPLRSLAHFAHSLARRTVNNWLFCLCFFLFLTIVSLMKRKGSWKTYQKWQIWRISYV